MDAMDLRPRLRLKVRLRAAAAKYLLIRVASSANATTNTPILTLPSTGSPLVGYLNVTAVGFTPTSYQWSWVANPLNTFAVDPTGGTSPFGRMAKQTKFTLRAEGIYQFVVTASDGANSVTKNTWVNVWSSKPAYCTDGSVGNNPGINPPGSVRVLYPEPGAFNHPRLFFTASDWAELSAKQTSSTDVKAAITYMQAQRNAYFDNPGTTVNTLATYFNAYSVGGYTASDYATLKGIYVSAGSVVGDLLLGKSPGPSSVYDSLACACYYEWLQYDATLAVSGASDAQQGTFAYLAAVIAGAAQFELLYNGSTTPRYNLAFCYDVAYNWMSGPQQLVVRSYLYAIGYGIYNNSRGGLSVKAADIPPYISSGSNQNGGDFPNLVDGIILPALAIEGEETTVPASVRALYGTYTPPVTSAWSGASAASVSNLRRQLRHNCEWNLTRWGFVLNMVAYFNLGQNIAMLGSLAFARRWEDQFVTTNIYQSCLATLYNLCLREVEAIQGIETLDIFDHHDGGASLLPGNDAVAGIYLVKYMYPDDPAVDYLYRVLKAESTAANYPLGAAIFATDLSGTTLFAMAAAKGLGNFKFDPHRATFITRNGWLDTDFMLQFENRWDADGHMHAEKNNFSLYALGRAWSNPPGYHITVNDSQASILVQIPSLASDAATAGYIGQSPSSATQIPGNNNFPPMRGKLLDIVQDPAGLWTNCSGDASSAYTLANKDNVYFDSGFPIVSLTYPGLSTAIDSEDLAGFTKGNLIIGLKDYNSVFNAKRTVFTVLDPTRQHPYALVLDDFCKDGSARNYRWTMGCCISFGGGNRFTSSTGGVFSSLAMLGTATPTQIVVYHSPIDDAKTTGQTGLPRLLVRDVANIPGNSAQPAIFIDDRPDNYAGGNLTYGYDNNQKAYSTYPSRRVMIQRSSVVQPGYQVLLYPFSSTATNALPVTTWTSATTLQITHVNNVVDVITFAAQAAIPASGTARVNALKSVFTKIVGFSRANGTQALPTISVPKTKKVLCKSKNAWGLPTYKCNFSISAKDAKGASLAFSSNGSKGSFIPTGVQRVWVSTVDSVGQQVSTSFIVLALPSAPTVTISEVQNLATPYSVGLSWSYWTGVTGYKVKRSTTKGGPYKVIATLNRYTTTYTDTKMPAATTYYVVTALISNASYKLRYESAHSAELSTAPPANGLLLSTRASGGVVVRGSSTSSADYLLTSSLGIFSTTDDFGTLVSTPVSGNGTYIARCKIYTRTSVYGSFGLDYRATLATGALSAFVGYYFAVKPFIYFLAKTSTAAASTAVSVVSSAALAAPAAFPIYFRLQRSGMFFFASYSQDGTNYNSLGSARISLMPTAAHVSLAMGATSLASADFDATSFLN